MCSKHKKNTGEFVHENTHSPPSSTTAACSSTIVPSGQSDELHEPDVRGVGMEVEMGVGHYQPVWASIVLHKQTSTTET